MHEKSVVFFAFFSKYLKTDETILIKKMGRNHGISVYKKGLISKHRKNYIFRDNNCFVKMSVSLLVSLYRLPNFSGRASTKTSVDIKTKFQT